MVEVVFDLQRETGGQGHAGRWSCNSAGSPRPGSFNAVLHRSLFARICAVVLFEPAL